MDFPLRFIDQQWYLYKGTFPRADSRVWGFVSALLLEGRNYSARMQCAWITRYLHEKTLILFLRPSARPYPRDALHVKKWSGMYENVHRGIGQNCIYELSSKMDSMWNQFSTNFVKSLGSAKLFTGSKGDLGRKEFVWAAGKDEDIKLLHRKYKLAAKEGKKPRLMILKFKRQCY